MAEAIREGVVASDVWVAAPGGTRWMRALDVPAIAALLDDVPLGPPRRDSGMRLVPLAFTADADGAPSFSSTMIMVGTRVEAPDAYAATFESPTLASAARPVADVAEPAPTQPSLGPAPSSPSSPSSPSPSPIFRGGDTLASPVAPLSPRRRKNG